jgi:hypothetical protein
MLILVPGEGVIGGSTHDYATPGKLLEVGIVERVYMVNGRGRIMQFRNAEFE